MTATRLLAVPLAIASTLAAAQQPAATPPTPGPQTQPAQTPSGTQPMPGPNGTYTITRTARIVILDMVVTDAKGNVVTDLSKDDFHVTDYSPWEGWAVSGWPVLTMLRGKVIVDHGRLLGSLLDGRALARKIDGPVLVRPVC